MEKSAQTTEITAEKVQDGPKMVALRGKKAASLAQRSVLRDILLADPEYENLADHIDLDKDIEDSLDADVRRETALLDIDGVMKVLHSDIQGLGAGQISTMYGLTVEQVKTIRRSSAYKTARQAVLAEVVNTSRNIMEVASLKAVKTLAECMNSKNEKVKLAASVEVLNRVGLNSTQKLEVTTQSANFSGLSDAELAEILRNSVPADGYEVITDGGQ